MSINLKAALVIIHQMLILAYTAFLSFKWSCHYTAMLAWKLTIAEAAKLHVMICNCAQLPVQFKGSSTVRLPAGSERAGQAWALSDPAGRV